MAIYKDVEPFIKWLEKEIEQFGEPNISIRPVAYGSENALRSVLNKMKELPEADVMEVVRCKKCNFCQKIKWNNGKTTYHCEFSMSQIIPEGMEEDCLYDIGEFFCGLGKRNLSELPTD